MDEIAFHLDMREAEYRREGIGQGDARTAARRDFGNVTSLKGQDARYAGPSLRSRVFGRMLLYTRGTRLPRSPGIQPSSSRCLALTLGIAGNTTIFPSLVDAVRVKSLPYSEPERLVVLWGYVLRTTLERRGASYPDFLDWRERGRRPGGTAAAEETMMTLSGVGEATAHSRRAGIGRLFSAPARSGG